MTPKSATVKQLDLKSFDRSTSLSLAAASVVAFSLPAIGCAAASDFDEAGDEFTTRSTEEVRRPMRANRSPSTSTAAPAQSTAAPAQSATASSSTGGTVYQWGAVTMDENGVITLLPGAFAPNDDGTDAVGGPSPNVGTPGTLPQQNGGTCPGNAPTSGACAHYGDQCVYATSNRSGYCTCINSTPSTPGALGWSCY
ncbi:MAG TPA: hypothetical protein VGK73_06920 [Polyangiaceae bacterium]